MRPTELETLLDLPQLDGPRNDGLLLNGLNGLTAHHREHCPEYRRLLEALGIDAHSGASQVEDLPWLPVRLFKEVELRSIPEGDVFRTLTSSGTTGASVSRIALDRDAAALQAKALARTLAPVLGPKRLPMLIVDSKSVTRGASFSARGAGVLGMMNFGRSHCFALNDDLALDRGAVNGFLERFGDEPFLIFGFTFMVWTYLYEPAAARGLDLSMGSLIHSGGWKKLVDRSIENIEFKRRLRDDLGISAVHNYYGMVEQIGTVFVEGPGENSGLYAPTFADVLIRHPRTLEVQPVGEPGVIEVLSLLPRSYPGHALLTEDLGVIDGIDDGPWPGKRLRIIGRLPRAEARGCSDTFSSAAA